MQPLDDEAVAAALSFPALIEALREAFRGDAEVPVRHHHTVPRSGDPDATLLLMPAWTAQGPDGAPGPIGTKIVNVFPGNARRGLPAVSGLYLLFDGRTGQPLTAMNAAALTARRTAAASALAADYLARPETARMLMVGAGALAPNLVAAHAAVRPIRRVAVWNHNPQRAAALAARLSAEGFDAAATEDLEGAAREADLISCATLSQAPLIQGGWLQPGCHLDLVGAFTPQMREADDAALRRAAIFVDTRAGASKEAGEIVQGLASGALAEGDIRGDLFELSRGKVPGRRDPGEITLFKSVGTALEDLAAAMLVARHHGILQA